VVELLPSKHEALKKKKKERLSTVAFARCLCYAESIDRRIMVQAYLSIKLRLYSKNKNN
jgi:hypothetical protein